MDTENTNPSQCELVPLLTDAAFRRSVVGQPGLADPVRAYWQRYETMSDGERTTVITPLINKVEAFTSRSSIRLMLGQSDGFNLRDVFTHRKTVLISLAKGALGEETTRLLGSLLVSLLWQATLTRASIPAEQRHPCFAYVDEAAELMRLAVPLNDMAAQARGLGLGLVLATQILAQVPDSFKAAFLGTIRSQATFAVEHGDAKLLEARFAPLTADDLQGLGRYEVALRPCLDGVTHAPLTLTTLPLPEAVRDGRELAASSQIRYGGSRADVEASLKARLTLSSPHDAVGRRQLGGRS